MKNDSPARPGAGTTSDTAYVSADRTDSPFTSVAMPRGHEYFRQLRRRFGWRLIIVYVTPLVILSVYLHHQYGQVLREGIDTHLKSIADNQRNTVDLYLQERTANLRSILASMELGGERPSEEAMRVALQQLRADSAAFVDVGLFAPDGRLVSYAGPHAELQGQDYSDEEWYKRVLEAEGRAYISDVYLGFRRKPHFIIAVTREVAGRPWALRASVDPDEFSEFVGRSHLISEAEAFIVNNDGRPQTSDAVLDPDHGLLSAPLGRPDTSVGEMRIGGAVFLAAVAPLRKNDWSLVVGVPEVQARAPLRRAEVVVGSLMLVCLIGVVAVALGSTRRLVGRLEETDLAREDLQRQLFNAAKLASVGEVAAGVAHEINNPLAIIYEEAGMMLDTLNPEFDRGPDMDEFRERLTVIEQASIRGRNITRQLLAFSRKDEPNAMSLDINRIVLGVLSVKETEFAVSNIEVVTDLGADLPRVYADRGQMEQVLLNLLNNARDAIRGPGRVSIRTRQQNDSVQIRVSDDGCGMTKDVMEQVFFPFFTTKEVGKGTGLGLSISYGIVKALGGNIEVESQRGVGTTFVITLPMGSGSKSTSRRHSADGSR